MKPEIKFDERNTMKKLPVALFICLLYFSVPSQAENVEKILDASAEAEIMIINIAGDVEVEGWSRNQVEVKADLGSGVEELIFEVHGNEVEIEVRVPQHHGRSISADLVIKVPEKSSLEISTVSADITVNDVRGRQQLETVSGDIDTESYASDFDVESVSGDIDVKGDNSKIRTRANSVSGDIEVEHMDGEIEISTVSGDLVLYNSKFETVEIQTVNGDIIFHSGLYGDSRMDVETVNGDVDIKFSGDVSARFDIETFNGRIRNCFGPEPVRTSEYTPGRELRFTEGDGEGRVEIRTLNGGLRLCRE
jgi:hypothetical protein